MLGRFRVGADVAQAEVRLVGARRPHLLPVHHEMPVVQFGPGGQRRQVAPRVGLAHAEAPRDLALQGREDEAFLLGVGAVLDDGCRADGQALRIQRAGHHPLGDDLEVGHPLLGRGVATAELGRPARNEIARLVHLPLEGARPARQVGGGAGGARRPWPRARAGARPARHSNSRRKSATCRQAPGAWPTMTRASVVQRFSVHVVVVVDLARAGRAQQVAAPGGGQGLNGEDDPEGRLGQEDRPGDLVPGRPHLGRQPGVALHAAGLPGDDGAHHADELVRLAVGCPQRIDGCHPRVLGLQDARCPLGAGSAPRGRARRPPRR